MIRVSAWLTLPIKVSMIAKKSVDVINERLKQYCIDNKIALTSNLLKKSKREKILMLDLMILKKNYLK